MAILAATFAGSVRCRGFCLVTHPVWIGALLFALALGIATPPSSIAQSPAYSEFQIKAAFLVNFPKYAEWPPESFPTTNSPIIIAVLAETRVADEIEKVIGGYTFRGRGFVLHRLASGEEPGACHILFMSAAEQQHSPTLLVKLKNTSVLTVGESDDFLASGGIINLARQNQKIAMEVNLIAAGNARIKISSKLLNLAKVVEGKSN